MTKITIKNSKRKEINCSKELINYSISVILTKLKKFLKNVHKFNCDILGDKVLNMLRQLAILA
jgi:hypothetical protein